MPDIRKTIITLPYPPSVNNLFLTTKKGKRTKSERYQEYLSAVQRECMARRVRPLDGDLAILVQVYRPRKVGDLDNSLKAILDSLKKGGAFFDDVQIAHIEATRFEDKTNPRVDVEITQIRKET